MATLSIVLDKRRGTLKGTYPIKLKLSHKSVSTTISTGINIRAEHWNGQINKAVLPKCPNSRAINQSIEALFFKFSNKLRELESDGKLEGKSAAEIKKLLTNTPVPDKESFINYFSRYSESRRTENSKDIYRYTLNEIKSFDENDIPFEKINVIWLKAFDAHLENKGASINTRAIHFRNLRAVFNSAINDDLIGLESYPFRKFKIASSRKDKEALTEEQFQRLIAYDTPYPFRRTARDLFLLSFFMCGMNLVDLYNLDRIHDGRAHFVRQKTSGKNANPVSILVQPEAVEIISRYAGKDHVLRFIEARETYKTFNNRIQKAMRAIGRELNIEGLTFYWARYTWATMADKLGISEKEISKGLGHVDTSIAGKFYISYDWTKVDRANRTVIDYIKNLFSPSK